MGSSMIGPDQDTTEPEVVEGEIVDEQGPSEFLERLERVLQKLDYSMINSQAFKLNVLETSTLHEFIVNVTATNNMLVAQMEAIEKARQRLYVPE